MSPTLLVLALLPPSQAAMPSFEDASTALSFSVDAYDDGGDGFYGAGWLDYDGDGDLDVYLVDGIGHANGLFANQGDGTFVEVTVQAGVEATSGGSMVLAADLDNDGWTDLLTTGDGGVWAPANGGADSAVRTWFNNGDGTFTDATLTSGLVMPGTGMPATAGDIDNDGDLDVYIGSPGSVVTDRNYPNRLFVNNGDRTFTDASVGSGVNTLYGACAATFIHLDDDAFVDLLVSNCSKFPCCEVTPFEVLLNNGDGTFTDARLQSQMWGLGFWMGHTPGDFDNNGTLDWFVTNTQRKQHALYLGSGWFTWTDRAVDAGVADWEFGWGTVSPDLDNDGYTDIYYVGSFPDGFSDEILGPGLASPGHLFRNLGDGTFAPPEQPVDLSCRFTTGLATADYDDNGFADLLVVSAGTEQAFTPLCTESPGNPVLLRNQGNGNHWLKVDLDGTRGNSAGIGAVVRLLAGGLAQTRYVTAGASFVSTDAPWPLFGLGSALEAEVCVRWPDGTGEAFGVQAADQRVRLVEGAGLGQTDCEPGWAGFDQGTGTGSAGTGTGSAGTGTGSAGTGTGSAGTGTGSAGTGSGSAGTGTGSAGTGSGSAGTGSAGTGSAGTGSGSAATGAGSGSAGTGTGSAGTGTTADTGSGGKSSGCGCAMATRSGSLPGWLALWVVLAMRRRDQ